MNSMRLRPDLMVENLSTDELLDLYEQVFGPLDVQAKERILREAHARGWDWVDMPVAA